MCRFFLLLGLGASAASKSGASAVLSPSRFGILFLIRVPLLAVAVSQVLTEEDVLAPLPLLRGRW